MKRQEDARDLDWSVIAKKGEKFTGTSGDDHLVGTPYDDLFKVGQGGNDTLEGGSGNDTFRVRASLTSGDHIDGGYGYDAIVVAGRFPNGFDLPEGVLVGVERVSFVGDGSAPYYVTLPEHMGNSLQITMSAGYEEGQFTIDGSMETYGIGVTGSWGNDVIIGGSANDGFYGNFGGDTLTGGGGYNSFEYFYTGDSPLSNPDVITDFKHGGDLIDLYHIRTERGNYLHFGDGNTGGPTGDVLISYDTGQDATFINIFTNRDHTPDMVIRLEGDHSDLTADDFNFNDPYPLGLSPQTAELPHFPELTPAPHQIAIV